MCPPVLLGRLNVNYAESVLKGVALVHLHPGGIRVGRCFCRPRGSFLSFFFHAWDRLLHGAGSSVSAGRAVSGPSPCTAGVALSLVWGLPPDSPVSHTALQPGAEHRAGRARQVSAEWMEAVTVCVTHALTCAHSVAGVLLELGLEKEHVTKQQVEQYVLKLDAEAQTKFKSFLQNSFQNPHTLFVLIHDHAHWDLVRFA